MKRSEKSVTKIFLLTCFLLFAARFHLTAQDAANSSAQKRPDPLTASVSAAPLWEQSLDDTVRGTPHLQASSVVLVGENGSVKSFFMSGTPLWNFDTRDKAVRYIARSYEAATYLCNTAGVFMAINRVGRELWRVNFTKPVTYSPLVGWDGRVFIPVDSMISCRTASGNSLWSKDLGSPFIVPPILDHDGSVASVLQNMDFIRINQFGVTERLRIDRLPSRIIHLKADDQSSYILLYQSGETDKITFNDKSSAGGKLSRVRFRSLPSAPAEAVSRQNRFAVTLRDGKTICLDDSGAVLWTANSHETAEEKGSGSLSLDHVSMVFDERGIYTISVRGITGFSEEGRRRFILRLQTESSGIPALSDEGLLYACGKDNKLRVYKTDAKMRTIPRSKYYGPFPEGSYGMGSPPPSPWFGDNARFNERTQMEMAELIEKEIRSGQLGEKEPVYAAYLMEMIGFFIGYPHYSPARPPIKPPERVKLIRLLGLIGSRETVPFLWNIFDKDNEPIIRRACADAIGVIGVDPTGRSFVSYSHALAPGNPNVDPQLVLSATSSIAKLCRFSGPPLAADGVRVMRYFTTLSTVPNPLKIQIQEEINALRKEGLDTVIE